VVYLVSTTKVLEIIRFGHVNALVKAIPFVILQAPTSILI